MAEVTEPSEPVSLRPLLTADAAVIAEWATDREFALAADWTPDLAYAEYLRFHQRVATSPPRELIRLAAVRGGSLVGYVDLHGEEPDRRELGFVVGPRGRWGGGLGFAVARAGVRHGFGDLRLQEIWAEALAVNEPSIRILRRLGFSGTGRGDDAVFRGQNTHYRRFTLTVDRWRRA